MAGIPIFEASMTVNFPDASTRSVPVGWLPTGVIHLPSEGDELNAFLSHLESFGEGANVSIQVVLDDDPTVTADVGWDDILGFAPEGPALADYVRKNYPDDCAYLDEVKFAAYIVWALADGTKFRQGAKWFTSGEVRPRFNSDGPDEQVRHEEALFHTLMTAPASLHNTGTVFLEANPDIQSKVSYDEANRQFMAPCANLAEHATPLPLYA